MSDYLPALRFPALTRFYDPLIAATTRERAFRTMLLDPQMLARARAKDATIDWREGRAERLPFADAAFDLVVSSLFFHHLPPAGKRAAAAEIRRVLRPGGRLAVADWGRPGDPLTWLASRALRAFDGPSTRESLAGALPAILREAGLHDAADRGSVRTAFGRMVVTVAARPRSADA